MPSIARRLHALVVARSDYRPQSRGLELGRLTKDHADVLVVVIIALFAFAMIYIVFDALSSHQALRSAGLLHL